MPSATASGGGGNDRVASAPSLHGTCFNDLRNIIITEPQLTNYLAAGEGAITHSVGNPVLTFATDQGARFSKAMGVRAAGAGWGGDHSSPVGPASASLMASPQGCLESCAC